MMRGTIAAQIYIGLLTIIALSFAAQVANMKMLELLLRTLRDIWWIVLVVLFQPELRRIFLILGNNRFVRFVIRLNPPEYIDEIVAATEEIVERGYGALMVVVRRTNLKMFIDTGLPLEAHVSKELLISIFNPKSPLHDGAVVIKDRIVEAARCTLPLSAQSRIGTRVIGTRHRAAIGITEQADVVAVVVSEDTGKISFCDDGRIAYGISAEELRQFLQRALLDKRSAERDEPQTVAHA